MQHKQLTPPGGELSEEIFSTRQNYFDFVRETGTDGFGVMDFARRWMSRSDVLLVDLRCADKASRLLTKSFGRKFEVDVRDRESSLVGVPDDVIRIYKELDDEFLRDFGHRL